jgi:hypothetical protein
MSLLSYQDNASKTQLFSDRFAMVLSSLCVLHCIATPLLLVAVPSLTAYSIFSGEVLHHTLLYFILPVGLFALTIGFLHHKQMWVIFLGLLGLTLLSAPLLLESALMERWHIDHHVLGENGETFLTIVGSIFVVIAHICNSRLGQRNMSFAKA